ncbi:MAG: DUF4863 family protein [Planctomycetota bacterium]|jgi:hypothetical protein|nr:DUF4863 family protein [Planctomycetota bacterium]
MNADTIRELLEFVAQLDLSDAKSAKEKLDAAFPFESDKVQQWGAMMREAVDNGTMCNHGEAPMQFSRIFKNSAETCDLSADAVLMNGAGPNHIHPQGEVDLCFAVDGEPRFDGNEPGWTVYAAGSQHIPTVKGGTMLILYLLPNGAFEFVK